MRQFKRWVGMKTLELIYSKHIKITSTCKVTLAENDLEGYQNGYFYNQDHKKELQSSWREEKQSQSGPTIAIDPRGWIYCLYSPSKRWRSLNPIEGTTSLRSGTGCCWVETSGLTKTMAKTTSSSWESVPLNLLAPVAVQRQQIENLWCQNHTLATVSQTPAKVSSPLSSHTYTHIRKSKAS